MTEKDYPDLLFFFPPNKSLFKTSSTLTKFGDNFKEFKREKGEECASLDKKMTVGLMLCLC